MAGRLIDRGWDLRGQNKATQNIWPFDCYGGEVEIEMSRRAWISGVKSGTQGSL